MVASVDIEHAKIMTARIRAQLERITDLKTKSTLTITTAPVEIQPVDSPQSLEKQN